MLISLKKTNVIPILSDAKINFQKKEEIKTVPTVQSVINNFVLLGNQLSNTVMPTGG